MEFVSQTTLRIVFIMFCIIEQQCKHVRRNSSPEFCVASSITSNIFKLPDKDILYPKNSLTINVIGEEKGLRCVFGVDFYVLIGQVASPCNSRTNSISNLDRNNNRIVLGHVLFSCSFGLSLHIH